MLQKSADARKKLPPLKPNLALPTWGQKSFESEAESCEIPDFDLGHPVYAMGVCIKPQQIPLTNLQAQKWLY